MKKKDSSHPSDFILISFYGRHLHVKFIIVGLFLAIVATSGPIMGYGGSDQASEYSIKAAFLYNFMKFIDWPQEAFEDAVSPLRLCVLGTDPFGDTLDSIQHKTVNGRKVVIKRIDKVEEAVGYHMMFISASEKGNIENILRETIDSPMVTVSDFQDFCHIGGMINFIIVKDKIHFEINQGAAERVKVKVSAQLLKLARIVETQKEKQ